MTKIIDETARQILDIVPLVMRIIRSEFRGQRSADLTVPQFRTLAFIKNNDGASLSSLAAHIGLTLPSMSKLIDGMVSRGFVSRSEHPEDRRRICLTLTPLGKSELEAAHNHTEAFLVDKISGLPREDLEAVSRSMQIFKDLFASERAEKSTSKDKA